MEYASPYFDPCFFDNQHIQQDCSFKIGNVLTQSPDKLSKDEKFYQVPTIIGDQEDEGTIFSLFMAAVNSDDQFIDYLVPRYSTHITKTKLSELVSFYFPSIVKGSPFRTGLLSKLYPGLKRNSALLGDFFFTLS